MHGQVAGTEAGWAGECRSGSALPLFNVETPRDSGQQYICSDGCWQGHSGCSGKEGMTSRVTK